VKRTHSPAGALRWFSFRQTIKGAVLIGILAGGMAIMQAFAYQATFPTKSDREHFAASLEAAPGLGVIYGEAKNIESPAGYMVYRTSPILGVIIAVWGIVVTTKLLRGQEEDGKLELICAGATTRLNTTINLLLGFSGSILIAFLITAAIICTVRLSQDISLSFSHCALVAAATFLPGIMACGLSVATCQFFSSRRRVLFWCLGVTIVLFALRSIGNTAPHLYWLKNFTPFGWADQLSPVIDPRYGWLWPFLLVLPLVLLGIIIATKRDIGEGIIKTRDTVRSHFNLLRNATQFAVRENWIVFLGWTLAALVITVVIASLTSVATDALTSSTSLSTIVSRLGSAHDLKIAFIGSGMVFTVMILLVMATVSLGAICSEETKNYLDTLLTHPIRRTSWLISRFAIVVVTICVIALLCSLAAWLSANAQHITFDLGNFLLVGLTLGGTIIFTFGVGTLLYGLWPRIATAGMYVIIIWSFVIDLLGSVVTLDDRLTKSSLFHYIATSPSKSPDWHTFLWLSVLGITLAALGVFAFSKRDIITE